MKTIATSFAAILAAVLAAGLASAPAAAQLPSQQVRISYAGLDLASAEGRAALDLRIVHAARSTCGTPSSVDLRGRQKLEACVAEFRAEAGRQRDIAIARAVRGAEPANALSR